MIREGQNKAQKNITHHSTQHEREACLSIETSPILLTCRNRIRFTPIPTCCRIHKHTQKPPCLSYTHLLYSDSVKQPLAHHLCNLSRPCEMWSLCHPEGTEEEGERERDRGRKKLKRHLMIRDLYQEAGLTKSDPNPEFGID